MRTSYVTTSIWSSLRSLAWDEYTKAAVEALGIPFHVRYDDQEIKSVRHFGNVLVVELSRDNLIKDIEWQGDVQLPDGCQNGWAFAVEMQRRQMEVKT